MNSSQAGVVDDLRRELNEPLQQPIDAMQLPTSWFRPNSGPPLHQKKKERKKETHRALSFVTKMESSLYQFLRLQSCHGVMITCSTTDGYVIH